MHKREKEKPLDGTFHIEVGFGEMSAFMPVVVVTREVEDGRHQAARTSWIV